MVMFENDWIFNVILPQSGWKDWHIGNISQSNSVPPEMFAGVTVLSLFRCSNPRFYFLHQAPKNNPIHSSVSRLVIYAPMLGHPSQCQDNYTDGSSIHVWKPCDRSRYGGSWWEEQEMKPAFGWRRHSLRCWRFSDDTHTMSTARRGAELQPHGWKHMKQGNYRIEACLTERKRTVYGQAGIIKLCCCSGQKKD